MSKLKVGLLLFVGFGVTAVTAGVVGSGTAMAITRAANRPPPLEVTGHPIDVVSMALGETVTVSVRVPVGRSDDDGPLPVFWVTDGSGQGRPFMQTVESLSRIGMIPPAIVVDIPSSSRGRSQDFRPPAPGDEDTNAEAFLAFIRTEVMPTVEAEFNTTGPDVLVGYSLGGLFASWAFTEDPEAFDGWIAFSPSWWYENEMMVDILPTFAANRPELDAFFFTSLGTEEPQAMQRAFAATNAAMVHAAPPGLRWVSSETQGAGHGNNPQLSAATALTAFWGQRAP